MIELYAITDHPAPPLPEGAPIRVVAVDGLAVVCAPAGEGEVSAEALWRHEKVVEALMQDRDLLPVRYGTRFADEAAAARAVERRGGDLAAALDRVRGAVELSVRVHRIDSTGPSVTSGAEYIRAKAGSAAARDAVHAPLSALARASVHRPPSGASELLRAAYLVDRDAVGRFADLVARLQDASPDLRLLCTGPWPPYSFAER